MKNSTCANCIPDNESLNNCGYGRVAGKRILIYHPSNSKEGMAIKGTNLRVSFKYI